MSYNRYKNTQKRKNYLLIHNKERDWDKTINSVLKPTIYMKIV